ncbi:MAG TPA: hypothetical protein VKN64_10270 [Halanaerobiales bacterium]|nr:hypothetical protein [Halanaerobiales bacterium]
MKYTLLIIGITIVFIFSFTLITAAHKPVNVDFPATKQSPILIEDHQISWAAYTELKKINEVDYYKFEAKADEEIYANLLIPDIERLKDFHPTFALIGPGLPKEYEVENVTLDIDEEEGVIVKRYRAETLEIFFEPFTQTSYYVKQTLTKKAPTDGTYYLAVFDENKEKGKYVFAIGRKEKWKANEIIKLPKTWWDTRMFMEKEKSTYAITIGIGVVGLYLLSTLFK